MSTITPKSFLHKLLKKNKKELRSYRVGPHTIFLPKGHKLDSFQQRFPRYDYALGEIARIIYKHYPQFTAIDIGANIGDTAALICKHQNVPVLCVEGLPAFLDTLNKNALSIGAHIKIEASFVGSGEEQIPDNLEHKFGSCSILQKRNELSGNSTKSLKTILKNNSEFAHSKLIKIDTDGFDFLILQHALSEIKRMHPVLFWEHDICFDKKGEQDAEMVLKSLADLGYTYFIVYDNFGNFLMSLEDVSKFKELHLYLLSNKYHSRIIPYFDVCAIHQDDGAIYSEIKAFEFSKKIEYLNGMTFKNIYE